VLLVEERCCRLAGVQNSPLHWRDRMHTAVEDYRGNELGQAKRISLGAVVHCMHRGIAHLLLLLLLLLSAKVGRELK